MSVLSGRQCKEDEGSTCKVGMHGMQTYYEEMKGSHSGILWNEDMRRRCGVVDNAEKVKEAHVSLRWYTDVLRRDEEESLRDIME